jgi:hypothetical protein
MGTLGLRTAHTGLSGAGMIGLVGLPPAGVTGLIGLLPAGIFAISHHLP